jgi:hypothetical protein
MKLKLQFIITAVIVLAIYIPVAHGQANLTFSGGSGAPLSTTLTHSITYTITNFNCVSKQGFIPVFTFDEAGNPVPSGSTVTGTIGYSIDGEASHSILSTESGFVSGDITLNDLSLIGNTDYTIPSINSKVVLFAGTVTTNNNIAAAPPADSSYDTFIANLEGVRCSTNGIVVTTAATVSVSGRIVTAQGRGIKNITITMTDSHGNTRTARSTSFGYYRFDDVRAGETYIFTAQGKRFSFERNPLVHSIMEDTNNINFVADEQTVFGESGGFKVSRRENCIL